PCTGTVNLAFAPTPGQGYLFETWRMAQLHGHWAITAASVAVLPSRSAEPCQPGMTGYGPSRRPAVAALLRQVSATLGAASSVHASGTIQQGGKPLGLNLGITRSGEFSGQLSENGTVFTALATHGHAYVKLSPAFLRIAPLPATACSRFCGEIPAVPGGPGARSVRPGEHGWVYSFPDQRAGQRGQAPRGGDHRWPAGLAAAGFARKLALRRRARQAVCPAGGRAAAWPGHRGPDAVERGADPGPPASEPGRRAQPAKCGNRNQLIPAGAAAGQEPGHSDGSA